jgi:N-acetylglucosaminyldiphosphoundecaprenol N-acetyl-beta-D-mannosaminyltransferase
MVANEKSVPQISLLGCVIHNVSMDEAVAHASGFVERKEFGYATTPNVDHLIKLRKDESFRQAYAGASLVVPDGVPLLWASRLLGSPLKTRVNGTDFFESLCEMAARKGFSIYLLGGNPGSAERTSEVLMRRHPDLRIAGWYCPPFGFEKDVAANEAIRRGIRQSGADLLFVGLGAPKQELWISKYAAGTGVSYAVGIGVSFSFIAGEMKRAPRWLQRHGGEWLWRLLQEPARLGKRYLIDDLPFVLLVFGEWASRRNKIRRNTIRTSL